MIGNRFWMRSIRVLNVPVRLLVILFLVISALMLPLRSANAQDQMAIPALTTTGTLTEFSSTAGVPSAEQTYTVTGTALTENLVISAPMDFEISLTTGSGFVSTLSLPQSGGIVAETLIYVRLNRASGGSAGGVITHVSAGAAQADVVVSGVAIEPESEDSAEDSTHESDDIIWTTESVTCVSAQVDAASDDADQRIDNGAMDLDGPTTGNYLTMYRKYGGALTGTLNWWGMRFLNIAIPEGSTIASANITFRSYATASGSTESGMTFYGQKSINPATFTTTTLDITNRTRTTANVAWSVPQWAVSTNYTTPDLSTVVQEIVSQGGWATGQAMVILGQNTVTQERNAISYDSSDGATYAPILNICYDNTNPNITTSGTLSAFSTTPGVASAEKTYTVSGSNLTGNITITAPTGFQISTTSGSGFASTITLTPASGTVTATTIYVRLFSATQGSFGGNITHVSTDATTKNVAVTGTVTDQVCYEDVSIVASEDAYLSANNVTYNNGGNTEIHVDGTTGTSRWGALLKWDLSSLPSNATLSSVTLQLYVSDTSPLVFNLYNMRRTWVEGTSSQAASSSSSNWNTYNGSNSWGTVGAASTTTDRYDTNLWGAGTTSFSTTGSKTLALNSDGLAVVQGWVSGSMDNYGLTMQKYSGSTNNALYFSSSENTTEANRPTLILDYCLGSASTYTLTVGNDGHGTVTLNPSGGTYTAGSTVTLTPVPASGYTFATWSGNDAGNPSDNGNGTWSILMDANKSITANFSLIPVNVAPNQPVLVQPLDDATGVSTPPTLRVTVSDSNTADTLNVSFYGRAVGTSAAEDFTIIQIPDTQNHASSASAVLNSMMQWIANNKTTRNIVFATSMGDIVNTSSSATEYGVTDTAYDYLDAGNVAYSVGPGNHDIAMGTTLYPTYFGSSRFTGKPWYQGYYTSGSNNYNNYSFFTAGGMDFILINLQYSAGTEVLNWADALLKANPTKRGIVEQHDILNTNNTWVNQAPYTALKDNPNLFLMLCGHMHTSTDGAAYRAEPGDDGHTIHIMMADYQDYNSANNSGYIRILRFSPAADKIYGSTYSPYYNVSLTSTSNYDQTELIYDMPGGTAGAYTLIGTVNDVTNGANASMFWTGLANSTEYEWFATVSDGAETVTGSTWSLTTGTGTGNAAPVLGSIGTKSVAELVLLSFTATATDDGLPSGTLTYSLSAGSNAVPTGATIGSTSGVFSWTPTEAQGPGSYNFNVCVSDGSLSDCEAITVTVSEVNVAPVLNPIGPKSGGEMGYYEYQASATDADLPANTLTYSLVDGTSGSVPAGMVITPDGLWSWGPTEAQGPGIYIFDLCVSDGTLSDCETLVVTVFEVNIAPVLGLIGAKSIAELATLTFTATATDADIPANALTFSLAGAPTGASINSTSGVFSWTPTAAQGPNVYTFDVCVSDGIGSDCETITVTVTDANTAPVLGSIGAKSVAELATLSFTATATDGDLPAQSLTFSLANGTSGFVPTGASINSTTGAFSWTPTEAQGPGSYTFDVCVSDDSLSDCETIVVTVTEVNVAPILGSIGAKSVAELTPLSFTATATDADIPANTLTFSLVGAPTGASINSTSGVFSWTPTAAQGPNVYTFDVCVSDGIGSDCETISVTVSGVLSEPVAKSPFGTITKKSPNFIWTVVPTATQYRLVVVHKSGVTVLDKTMTNAICGTATCSYTPSPSLNLAVGNYTWKVQAYTGIWSAYSAIKSFAEAKIPSPRVPIISSTSPNPKFYWTKVYGQTRYQIILQTLSGAVFMNTMITSLTCNEWSCYFIANPALGLSNRAYKWKVRSYNNGVWGDWSPLTPFNKVDPPAPIVPSGVIHTGNPIFTWKMIPGVQKYNMVIWTSADVLIKYIEVTSPTCGTDTCSYTPSPSLGLANGSYKWKIRAHTGWYYGPFSAFEAFIKN